MSAAARAKIAAAQRELAAHNESGDEEETVSHDERRMGSAEESIEQTTLPVGATTTSTEGRAVRILRFVTGVAVLFTSLGYLDILHHQFIHEALGGTPTAGFWIALIAAFIVGIFFIGGFLLLKKLADYCLRFSNAPLISRPRLTVCSGPSAREGTR